LLQIVGAKSRSNIPGRLGKPLTQNGKLNRIREDVRKIVLYGNKKMPVFRDYRRGIDSGGNLKLFKPISPSFFEEAGIPEDLDSYPIKVFGPKIQDWLNVHHPGYRLVCFDEKGHRRPYFTAIVNSFHTIVPIYHYGHDGHDKYCGVRNLNSLYFSNMM